MTAGRQNGRRHELRPPAVVRSVRPGAGRRRPACPLGNWAWYSIAAPPSAPGWAPAAASTAVELEDDNEDSSRSDTARAEPRPSGRRGQKDRTRG